jgi:glutamyl/glutaminyl-tRNA synthetase
MKELDLPYIGVKIESLPTILSLLKNSKNDEDFISFYTSLGKSRKTATEYLASLRNLKLAKREKDGQTKINKAGKELIEDNIDKLYENLVQHCLRTFPDFKLLKQIWNKKKIENLTELNKNLEDEGLTIKRKQTLSSYFKLLQESKTAISPRVFFSFNYSNEPLEYNQFIKALKKCIAEEQKSQITLANFYNWLKSRFSIDRGKFDNYLQLAKNDHVIKLSEVNPRILINTNDAFVINNKYYYFLELI